jgi:hypothetical protein
MPTEQHPDFDAEFDAAVEGWKNRHRLREDDAVFLLIELFRIHQRHWDELRRRDFPATDQIRSEVLKCSETARVIQDDASTLLKALQSGNTSCSKGVSAATAFIAALCALVAGYLLGRSFP